MAIYRSDGAGNGPSGLKVGDKVVTSKGGTWQILDSNKYKNMTSDQLKSSGVSYNPVTGYYSTRLQDNDDASDLALANKLSNLRTYDKSALKSSYDAYLQQMTSELLKNFNTNMANLTKTYRDNYTNYYDQINSTKNDYAKNIQDLYDNTDLNNAMALQQAANRGMTSAAQGVAMGTSGLMSASQKASQLTSDRDTLISSIQSQLNRLTENYNVDKDLLEANFSADKLNAMSTARLEWLRASLDIDSDEIGTYNSFLNSHYQNEYNSNEAEKERQWNEKMSDKEFERQKELIALEAQYNRSYGGGGYYSYGGSGYSRSGGSSSGDFSVLNQMYNDGVLSESDWLKVQKYIDNNPNASASQITNYASALVGSNATKNVISAATKNTKNTKKSNNKSYSRYDFISAAADAARLAANAASGLGSPNPGFVNPLTKLTR